ncbi:MAG TPA: response regulator transcription factor [Chloroflexota bacterium]|nr:response regulator transcription factor [Chloroflexota bacterium]
MPKILIADDEPDVAAMVAYGVRMMWPDADVVLAQSGTEALRGFSRELPDLVVLDVSLPPPDGFDVLSRIRQISQVPIMMLTVRGATSDKVHAFDLGADDYLTKPFDHLELLARLRALLRRAQTADGAEPVQTISVGGLTLDPVTRQVRVDGRVVPLTATEYRLLEELMRHSGRTLPHQYLLSRVWGPEYGNDLASLRVFIQRLRDKLEDNDESPAYIQTERGIGYRLLAARHTE